MKYKVLRDKQRIMSQPLGEHTFTTPKLEAEKMLINARKMGDKKMIDALENILNKEIV